MHIISGPLNLHINVTEEHGKLEMKFNLFCELAGFRNVVDVLIVQTW